MHAAVRGAGKGEQGAGKGGEEEGAAKLGLRSRRVMAGASIERGTGARQHVAWRVPPPPQKRATILLFRSAAPAAPSASRPHMRANVSVSGARWRAWTLAATAASGRAGGKHEAAAAALACISVDPSQRRLPG
eukprot:366086-Chlamydomonas_euryale.AAC.9